MANKARTSVVMSAPTGIDQSCDNTESRSLSRGELRVSWLAFQLGVALLAVSGWVLFDRRLQIPSPQQSTVMAVLKESFSLVKLFPDDHKAFRTTIQP